MGGLREKGIRLTDSGLRCCNPECGAVLYVELMAGPDHEACFDCDPEQFRGGWHPMIVEAFAQAGQSLESFVGLAELYEQSGGRLPEWREYEGEPFFDDSDYRCPPHCSEACCRRKEGA